VKYTDLDCIRCGKTLPPSVTIEGDDDEIPPSDGLLFISYGNYGSTVYDPMGNAQEYLLVVICDEVRRLAGAGGQCHAYLQAVPAGPADPPVPWPVGPA